MSIRDHELVSRMAAGDPDALAALYEQHGRAIYSLALRMLRDQAGAEEVVQDVFSQAWRQASRYDPQRGAVASWLLVIARTRALDRLRSNRASQGFTQGSSETVEALPDPSGEAVEARLDARNRAGRVRHALAGLPVLQRLAIELAFFEGLTHAEIAQQLEQPLGTVKTRIRTGLLKLRDVLGEGAT